MKIKHLNEYRNASGNLVEVYAVSGSDQELQEYSEHQGENQRLQDADDQSSAPLYFTQDRIWSNSVELHKSRGGNYFIKSDESISPADFAQAKVNAISKKFFGNSAEAE